MRFFSIERDGHQVRHDDFKAENIRMERTYFPSPWWSLDERFGGVIMGGVTVIAARPSMGKSSMAEQITTLNASGEYTVSFCGIEMGKDGHASRMRKRLSMSSIGNVNHFMDCMKINWLEVEGNRVDHIIKLDQCAGSNILVIDYIQRVKVQDSRIPRAEQIALIMDELSGYANTTGKGVVVVSQMNRGIEDVGHNRMNPLMSDLKGSGGIEEAADIIYIPIRETILKGLASRPVENVKVYCVKNRHGQTGSVDLTWVGPSASFQEA